MWPVGVSLVASLSREGRWTLVNYGTVWRLYAGDVLYTVGVAAAGSVLTFAAAIPLCGWLRARAFGPVGFLLAGTVTGVVLVHLVGGLVFTVWTMAAVFRSIDPVLEEAAHNLGASATRAFLTVSLPLAVPGIVASALLVFLYSLHSTSSRGRCSSGRPS